MANALSIYTGTTTAGSDDGDLVTNTRKMSLQGLKDNTVIGQFAFRAVSSFYPAVAVNAELVGDTDDIYRISLDRASWAKKIIVPYVAGGNVLFFVKVAIPEDYDYGTHSNVYLQCDYFGGV